MKRNNKKLIMLASVLVLIVATIGGSIAYMAAKTDNVVNEFTFGNVPIDIPEQFDGTTKSDVKVHNNGSADAFVRAKIVVTWKNAAGEISGTAVKDTEYTLELNTKDWFLKDGFYYCTNRVEANTDSEVLINTATKADGVVPPEGYDLSIEILAQSVQADGEKNGVPMVENFWPVNAEPNNQHPQTIAAK